MLRDLADSARLEGGAALKLERAAVDVRRFVADVLDLTRRRVRRRARRRSSCRTGCRAVRRRSRPARSDPREPRRERAQVLAAAASSWRAEPASGVRADLRRGRGARDRRRGRSGAALRALLPRATATRARGSGSGSTSCGASSRRTAGASSVESARRRRAAPSRFTLPVAAPGDGGAAGRRGPRPDLAPGRVGGACLRVTSDLDAHDEPAPRDPLRRPRPAAALRGPGDAHRGALRVLGRRGTSTWSGSPTSTAPRAWAAATSPCRSPSTRRSTASRRRTTRSSASARELGEAAVRDALARAGLAPGDVDHLFFVTVTGHLDALARREAREPARALAPR